MVEKTFFFLAGLPRAGSTVLASILNQNPDIYVTPTSPLLDLLEYNEYLWNQTPSVIANPMPGKNLEISQAVINGCWEHINKPIIIDKCRGWVRHIPTIDHVFGKQAKIVVNVRDIPSIMASYIRVLRNAEQPTYIDEMLIEKGAWLNDTNRASMIWQQHIAPVYQWLVDAYRQFPERLLFVDYGDLVSNPKIELEKIYSFLGLGQYDHQYDNIENVTPENDEEAWRVKNLHSINKKLEKTSASPEVILGSPIYNRYARMNCEFWK